MPLDHRRVFYVDSFIGAHSTGNAHRVTVYTGYWPDKPISTDGVIAVDLKLEDPSTAEVEARFTVNGHIIKRCGSGTVAAAYILLHELGLPEVTLRTTCERLKLVQEPGRYGYLTQTMALVPASASPLTSVFGARRESSARFPGLPLACFAAGGSHDYLVAVLPEDTQLAELQPDLNALTEECTRALILTAPSTASDFDFTLRYFAPQYGVPEDSATGSANAVLASYWSQRLAKTHLRSQQLSKGGGDFYLKLLADCPPSNLLDPVAVGVLGQVRLR